MCLAAYVALGTGFTLSYTSAHLLMRALTALCISTLAFCVARRMVKRLRHKHSFNLQPTSTPMMNQTPTNQYMFLVRGSPCHEQAISRPNKCRPT